MTDRDGTGAQLERRTRTELRAEVYVRHDWRSSGPQKRSDASQRIGTAARAMVRDLTIQRSDTRAGAGRVAVGLALVAFWWVVAWSQLRPLSDYFFFPLWLGYIVTVDGIVQLRTGTSPISRSGWWCIGMFTISIPLWWVFEALNQVVGNWHYHAPARYTTLEYALLASLAFSTVVPAVLTTTELVRSFSLDPLRRLPAVRTTRTRLVLVHLAGWLMIVATVLWPRYTFPFVWLSVVFLLDPIAMLLGTRSLASYLGERDWSPVFNLGVGTLVCGWFWEMWNYYALPKWTYDVPFVDSWHVWEMPLPGYTGYLPFGLELYLFYVVVARVMRLSQLPQPLVSRHGLRATD
jgi:hypothetical protein